MAFEYTRNSKYKAAFDPKRCKASVHAPGRGIFIHQCQRRHVRDGWCKQHHPDAEAERAKQSEQRYKEQMARLARCTSCEAKDAEIAALHKQARQQLNESAEVIHDLTAERDKLREALETVVTFLDGEGVDQAPKHPCRDCGYQVPWGGDDEVVCRSCAGAAARRALGRDDEAE